MRNTNSRLVLACAALLAAACGAGVWWWSTRATEPAANADASARALVASPTETVLDGAATGDSPAPSAGDAAAVAVTAASGTSPATGAASNTSPAPLPPPDTPLAQVIDELERRARAGDTAASCRLGFELLRCRRAAEMVAQRALLDQIVVLSAARGLGTPERTPQQSRSDQALIDVAARSELMVEQAEGVCTGVDAQRYATPMSWLLQAAGGGEAASRAALIAEVDAINAGDTLANLDALARFRALAPAWIAEEIERGGDALQHAARISRSQTVSSLLMQSLRDRPALAHALFLLDDNTTTVAGGAAITDAMRAAAQAKLPPADAAVMDEATALAERYKAARATRSPGSGGASVQAVMGPMVTFDPGVSAAACGRAYAPMPQ